jgi:glutathione S-transferase
MLSRLQRAYSRSFATMSAAVELVTNPICPFAQRAWLALEETAAPYVAREASLKEKPAWFTDVYRSAIGHDATSDGKVPVLVDGDFVLSESAVVATYVVDKWGAGTALAPFANPADKARAAIFVDQVGGKLIKHFYGLLSAQEAAAQEAHRADLLAVLRTISSTYAASGGPFFLGATLSLADILVWPWLARLCVVEHYRDLVVPETPEYDGYRKFAAAMSARETVQRTQRPAAYYIDGYVSYATGARIPK